MEIDFPKLQAHLIAGDLNSLEVERKTFTTKFSKYFFLCLVLFIGIPLAIYFLKPDSMFAVWIAGGIILIGSALFLGLHYNKFHKYFKEQFKGKVIPAVVKFVDERLEYDAHRGLINEYSASRIFPRRADRYRAEDTISGKFDLTTFSFGEIHTEYKSVSTDNKGNRKESWHTIFKGMFFVSDFHKDFQGETIIDVDNMERFFGNLGREFQKINPDRVGSLVKLENPEFEKKFAVYSTDEQECRYILTPSMMERLVEMSNKINFKISISFRNKQIYIAVFNNMDLFEPSVFGSLLKEDDYRIIITIMRLMTGVIEDLNLNTRIWTKE